MNKLTLVIVLFFYALLSQAVAKENVTLQLAWKHQFQSAGYYMAKEKGFYEKVGLDVTIKEYDNTTRATDDVLNGKSDFSVGRSSIIHDRRETCSYVSIYFSTLSSCLVDEKKRRPSKHF